jgi:hypothetical protein
MGSDSMAGGRGMSDAVSITVNVPEFERAIKEYEKAVTNHDMPYILNRAGRNVATKASKYSPRASIEQIDAALADRHLFRLVNYRRKKQGLPALGGPAMSAPAIAELKRRHSSRGYIAAGWTPAIIKFGGHSRAHISSKSKISHAENHLATAGELVAVLENAAVGAGKAGAAALSKALADTSRDMLAFAQERLDDTSKKYSSK